jgi:bis(5'-nucleosyl)-tetraphosphatase (symmetrical)
MAVYAIGDVQGCLDPLERLLAAVRFDPSADRLWFVGDLVNRGPDSLGCLRFVKGLGEAAVSVLGNHDLHLLCVSEGVERKRSRDTLDGVLGAPDRDELLHWLRHRPLLHVEDGFALVHAALLPEWTVARARELAAQAEAMLRGPGYRDVLSRMYGDEPTRWSDSLEGMERFRATINAMTRLRVCDRSGAMALGFKGEPGEAPGDCVAWFDMPRRRNRDHTILFGHWSALGLLVRDDIACLDSGCVWERSLSALRLEDRRVFEVPCEGLPRPAARPPAPR